MRLTVPALVNASSWPAPWSSRADRAVRRRDLLRRPGGVLGPNGSGKSHFLRLLGGRSAVEHPARGSRARRSASGCSTADDVAWLAGRYRRSNLATLDLGRSERLGWRRSRLRPGELALGRPCETLSGGQQARLQILVLELLGANVLLLDEPTDNLDMLSAEALEEGGRLRGTVLSVTHDRWFMRTSTATWCSAPTAASTPATSQSGMSSGWSAPADRPAGGICRVNSRQVGL